MPPQNHPLRPQELPENSSQSPENSEEICESGRQQTRRAIVQSHPQEQQSIRQRVPSRTASPEHVQQLPNSPEKHLLEGLHAIRINGQALHINGKTSVQIRSYLRNRGVFAEQYPILLKNIQMAAEQMSHLNKQFSEIWIDGGRLKGHFSHEEKTYEVIATPHNSFFK